MAINSHQQDVIANNLANADTAGFKRDQAVFQERLQEAQVNLRNRSFLPANLKSATGGAFVADTHTDLSQGGISLTRRNLDVALTGSGYLAVQDGDQVRYTRDGRLAVVEGKLVRQTDGKAVLDESGREIALSEASAGDVRIDTEGNVTVRNQPVGKLGLTAFNNPQDLQKVGANLYDAVGQPPRDVEISLVPEALETSTVSPTYELVEMIKVSRGFQLNAQMLGLQDQTLGRLVSELPRI